MKYEKYRLAVREAVITLFNQHPHKFVKDEYVLEHYKSILSVYYPVFATISTIFIIFVYVFFCLKPFCVVILFYHTHHHIHSFSFLFLFHPLTLSLILSLHSTLFHSISLHFTPLHFTFSTSHHHTFTTPAGCVCVGCVECGRRECVVAVLGAGRGPIVREVLRVQHELHTKLRVYAVEKNQNAVNTCGT